MPEIPALIFDLDGVIVHSNPLHLIAWAEYCRTQGMEASEASQRAMYGKRNDQIVRDLFGDHLTEAEVFAHGAAKEQLYREMLSRFDDLPGQTLVPGIQEFLARHQDAPCALATNAEPENVRFVLAECSLRPFFRVTVDGHQVKYPKPHPEIYLRAAELLGARPESCVVFEDSYAGVQAGLAAGMPVVGLTTTHPDLPGAALLIADFNDPELEVWLRDHTGK